MTTRRRDRDEEEIRLISSPIRLDRATVTSDGSVRHPPMTVAVADLLGAAQARIFGDGARGDYSVAATRPAHDVLHEGQGTAAFATPASSAGEIASGHKPLKNRQGRFHLKPSSQKARERGAGRGGES